MSEYKSGFVGIVGPTNSGKSTLLNSIVGTKVSIVSAKVQTTYHGVRGILTTPRAQIVFTDTPGFQKHSDGVARLLNKVADKNAKDAEILVWVFDASNPRVLAQIEKLKDRISNRPKEKSFLVLNKVDKIPKHALLPMIAELSAKDWFDQIIPTSAEKGVNVKELVSVLESRLQPGEKYFPEDMVTDRNEQFMVSELVREKIYRACHEEIPYSAWIEIEDWELSGKVPVIRAVIHVDSESRKGILIGKGGEMLKRIGTSAREEAEKMFGQQICLKLHVDVEPDWKSDSRRVNQYLELT